MSDGDGVPLDKRDFVPVHDRILVSEAAAAQLCSVRSTCRHQAGI